MATGKNIRPQMEEWHRRVAKVGGGIALRLTQPVLSKSEIQGWATELELVAKSIRETVPDKNT